MDQFRVNEEPEQKQSEWVQDNCHKRALRAGIWLYWLPAKQCVGRLT